MAGGPILPSSVYLNDTSGALFAGVYSGAGGNTSPVDVYDIGVKASLGADKSVELRFPVPPSIPSGTVKLRTLMLANATSGTAKWTVADGRCPAGSSPSAATLTTETQSTLTWSAGNNDQYLETKLALTGLSGLQANDTIVVTITFNTSGWTLAALLAVLPSIIWE